MMKENKVRCCSDCKATQTPLWRTGPAGPKSLCNACGIRYRKKGIFSVNWSNGPPKRKKRERKCGMSSNDSTISSTTSTSTSTSTNTNTNSVSAASATGPTARTTRSTTTSAKSSVGRDINESHKARLVRLGKEVIVKGSPPAVEKKLRRYERRRRREWGEVEQAAVCLLAMSCDSVFG